MEAKDLKIRIMKKIPWKNLIVKEMAEEIVSELKDRAIEMTKNEK